MAKAPRAIAEPPTPNRERPAEPQPYEASRDELLDFYKQMLLIRRFEEKAGQLYGLGLIGGFCHLYIGQEAVAVGLQSALSDKDSVITGYRDHGHMLLCRIPPKTAKRFYGGHGIVGAQVSLGTGLAWAHKYRGDGGVALAYFGDGAANQGQVYESFNMAELWKLPIVYVIENNQYAMGTSVNRASAEDQLYRRGESFRARMGARGQGSGDPGDEDLPLPRPFDVRPRQVPQPRGGAGGAREVGPDRADEGPAGGARHQGRPT